MKKYQELESTRKKCDDENTTLKNHNMELSTKTNELNALIENLTKQNKDLGQSNKELSDKYQDLSEQFAKLKISYDTIFAKNKELMYGKSSETKNILGELHKTQAELVKREDSLKKVANQLALKQKNLELAEKELAEKQAKLAELQSILSKKDSIVKALKAKVQNALLGFENKGLTIKQKNGKVYVSMDETLLFASGSSELAVNGVDALKKLAKVLETNPDINIMVEGHTDNVPYKGTGQILDNWDLSVMRANAVTKILLKNSAIKPGRITSAGRSEYSPIDVANTKEARSKNRRTEIILTPKLDELLNILESN
jgi:chemotaxis protein MotB